MQGGYYESNVDKCDDRNLNAVDDLNNVDVLYFDKLFKKGVEIMEKIVIGDGTSYKDWITEITDEFRKSQIRAAVKINDEMLRFYWKLGKDISAMSNQYGYGSGFYKILSADLKKVLPDVKSFSPTNLKYMRYFYELYPFVENRPQAVDDLNSIEISPHVVDDLSVIFRIPWHKDTAM